MGPQRLRGPWLVAVASVALAGLLSGCATGATSAPSPTPIPTPTPTAMPSPSPSAASERTYVSGTMTCGIVGEEDPTASGEYQPGTLLIDCACEMSDPRVTGTVHYELAATFVALDAVNGTSNFWSGTSTLEVAGGTWTGSGYGSEFVSDPIKPMTLYTTGADRFEGQGAFDGLAYQMLYARENPLVPGVPYIVSGWIEPAS